MPLNYTLIRSSRRKTIGLQVKNAEVIVRAPYFVRASFIEDFVHEKSLWLQAKVNLQQQYKKSSNSILPSQILIAGISHKINIQFAEPNIEHDQSRSLITISVHERLSRYDIGSDNVLTKAKKQLEQWLKSEFILYLDSQLPRFISATNLVPSSVKIRKYKARWGSCNTKKEISFNYLLIMMPHWVINYVIIHELSHLVHMNHSADFWRLVANNYPKYLEAKQWIKLNNQKLTLI